MSERSERMKVALKRMVRRASEWAWREKLDRLYTHEEVAAWLYEYHGRYRELTLTEWVERKRSQANTGDDRTAHCTGEKA